MSANSGHPIPAIVLSGEAGQRNLDTPPTDCAGFRQRAVSLFAVAQTFRTQMKGGPT